MTQTHHIAGEREREIKPIEAYGSSFFGFQGKDNFARLEKPWRFKTGFIPPWPRG
jgi:hypothetical protein